MAACFTLLRALQSITYKQVTLGTEVQL